jgi:ribosomal protein S18 acetylase RimI-like enzyme
MFSGDYDVARSVYIDTFPESPFFDAWVPRQMFLGIDYDEVGNLSISREDTDIYGIALGSNPVVPENWKKFSMESQGVANLPKDCQVVVEWDCYWAPTTSGEVHTVAQSEGSVIAAFLKMHAPESSVMPGNDEILQWIEIHRDSQLVAAAALCRWQSGRVVISSVATHSEYRGQGLGKELINQCLYAGWDLGEKFLSLGVRHNNESAQRLYAATGFRLMHNFTYCERR